jgi:hypothetical protein
VLTKRQWYLCLGGWVLFAIESGLLVWQLHAGRSDRSVLLSCVLCCCPAFSLLPLSASPSAFLLELRSTVLRPLHEECACLTVCVMLCAEPADLVNFLWFLGPAAPACYWFALLTHRGVRKYE